ncbi:MAG TPA: CBS domain-containing protein [Kiloniellales bacterium]|nr:CBS domain-containing protein [Kiloniellales bacterium]
MKIKDVMTADPRIAAPDQTIRAAAEMMEQADSGVLPVGENDRLVGMITDRDIAVRGVAQGLGPDTAIRDVMTREVKYCFEDEELDSVADNMSDLKVRRLPVLNREKRLVGMLSIGDFASHSAAQEAVEGVTRPGQPHAT